MVIDPKDEPAGTFKDFFSFLGRCIYKGWICCPVYFVKCVFAVDKPEILCNPLKQNCAPNGKKGGLLVNFNFVRRWLPIFEFLTILLLLPIMSKGVTPLLNAPVAYVNKQDLLKTNITFAYSQYIDPLGSYEVYSKKEIAADTGVEADFANPADKNKIGFTLFDRDMLNAWTYTEPTTTNCVNPSDRFNFTDTVDDFITFGNDRICIGKVSNVMSDYDDANCKLFSGMTNFTSTKASVIIGTAKFKDIPKHVLDIIANISGPTGIKNCVNMGIILMVIRFFTYLICPNELRRPGNQWITGFWTFVCCMLIIQRCRSAVAMCQLAPIDSAHSSYYNEPMKIRGAKKVFILLPWSNGVDQYIFKLFNTVKTLAMLAATMSVACFTIGGQPYCSDCTYEAYMDANIQKIKAKRAAKMV